MDLSGSSRIHLGATKHGSWYVYLALIFGVVSLLCFSATSQTEPKDTPIPHLRRSKKGRDNANASLATGHRWSIELSLWIDKGLQMGRIHEGFSTLEPAQGGGVPCCTLDTDQKRPTILRNLHMPVNSHHEPPHKWLVYMNPPSCNVHQRVRDP